MDSQISLGTLGGTIDVQAASTLDAYGSGGVLVASNTLAISTGTGGLTIASSNNVGGVGHTGWRLLVQTNHLASGISLNTND